MTPNQHPAETHAAPIPLWPEGAPGFNPELPDAAPTITPYVLQSGEAHPAFVVCPGGGYSHRAPHEGEPLAKWFNSFGISAFVCNYRVSPYRHPYPSLDAKRAIRWVRHHAGEWNIDPGRLGILGFSAGGHVTSTAGTHYDGGDVSAEDPIDRVSCRPDAMVLCYPVITFVGDHRHEGSMTNLLGENPPEELRQSLSNHTQVIPDTPPTFLWHTADDGGVPVENSLMFASALSRNRVPFELHVYPTGPHGLGMAPDHPHIGTWTKLCEGWLKELWQLDT